MADYEHARAAQRKLRDQLKGHLRLGGIGITERQGHYMVSVNVIGDGADMVPKMVDGVPVVVSQLGVVAAR